MPNPYKHQIVVGVCDGVPCVKTHGREPVQYATYSEALAEAKHVRLMTGYTLLAYPPR